MKLDQLKNHHMVDDEGQKIGFDALLSKADYTVLFFYPKDDTSGCTIENQEFEALKDQFTQKGAQLVGVSGDDVGKHQKFKQKYDLNHTLIADEELVLANTFGVWVEKKMYGKVFFGIQRATWLFDKQGNIVENWPKVKPKGHAQAVLDRIELAKAGT